MNDSHWNRYKPYQVLLVALVILLDPTVSLFAQSPRYSISTPTTGEEDERTAKLSLALDAASVAAEAGLFDLSFEAVQRVCQQGPPIAKPQIQSSLLGGQPNTATRVVSGRPGYQVPEVAVKYGARLFGILDKWKSKQAPAERIAEALDQIVFPANRPNEILLFSNAPSVDENSYSYEFTFSKPRPTRYLAFELIELAWKNKTLPTLIDKLEKMRALPSSQTNAVAMLVYAKRVTGQPEAASKVLEELVANPFAVDSTMSLYHALTQAVPEVGEAAVVQAAATTPILTKLLKQSVARMDIRGAALQQIALAIESDDQATLDTYVAMMVDSINQMPGTDQNTINYMLERFYRNLAEECKRLGKAAMSVEISTRAADVRTELGQGVTLESSMIASFAELQPEVRLKALRKMLVERPLVKLEQFSFAPTPPASTVPAFFHLTPDSDNWKKLLPYEGSKAISLLDLLLNETESQGNSADLVKELLANSSENNDVKRFLAVWLNLRAEKRGQPLDAELAKLAKFENEKEYIDWWMTLPVPPALELLYQGMQKEVPSEELQAAFEAKFTNEQPSMVSSDMRYQRRIAADKSMVDANRLKHWVISYEPISWQAEDRPPTWTFNEKHQLECFGGAWYGQLIFRYPLPLNSTIKVTADRTDKKGDGLYCGGVTTLCFDTQQGLSYAMAPNTRVLGQFTAQASSPTRALEGTFKDNSLQVKLGEKAIEVLDYGAKPVPFVGLANYGQQPSLFSDLEITAAAAIPREVSLLDEGLTGWSAGLFRHALPKLTGHIESSESDTPTSYNEDDAPPMWKMVDNELRDGKEGDEAETKEETNEDVYPDDNPYNQDQLSIQRKAKQSSLTYSRPLCEGESIEYEFFHQPETQNASPSIGRIAYLIRDGKISLKWIAVNNNPIKPEAESSNIGEDPASEVLATIKLESNAWNRVQVRIEGGKVVLSIAGTDVYRRPLEKDSVARFGFYCDPQKDQVRIRNVVLKGDWPTELPKDLLELK